MAREEPLPLKQDIKLSLFICTVCKVGENLYRGSKGRQSVGCHMHNSKSVISSKLTKENNAFIAQTESNRTKSDGSSSSNISMITPLL